MTGTAVGRLSTQANKKKRRIPKKRLSQTRVLESYRGFSSLDNNTMVFTLILSEFELNFNFNLKISYFTLTPNLYLKLKLNPKSDFLNDENIP